MREDWGRFQDRGASVVVVARHSSKEMRAFWEKNRLPFLGVPDPDAAIGPVYGQEWKLLRLGLMPALLVLDSSRKVLFSHYSSGMSDIPSNDTVLSSLT